MQRNRRRPSRTTSTGAAGRPAVARRDAGRARGASTRAPAARGSRSSRARRCARSRRAGSWSPSSSRRRGCGGARRRASTRLGRAARRAPGQAHLRRAALGRAPRAVVATERVTLYGLPIVAGRTVAYGRIDPELARELFIRRALVEGDWDTRHAFVAENARRAGGGRGARGARAPARPARRRPGAVRLLRRADPGRRRLGGALRPLVARRAAARTPTCSTYPRERARRPGRRPPSTRRRAARLAAGRPRAAALATASSRAPSTTASPCTCRCGAAAAPRRPLRVARAGAAAGARHDAAALAAQGPAAPARPAARDRRRGAGARSTRGGEPLLDARDAEPAARRAGPPAAYLAPLPPHLRMTFRVEDERRACWPRARTSRPCAPQLRPRLRAELAAATSRLERHGLRAWTTRDAAARGELPGTARRCAPTPRLSTRARPPACACSRRRPRSARRCGRGRGGCCAHRPRPPRGSCRPARQRRQARAGSARRTAASPPSRGRTWPRSTR